MATNGIQHCSLEIGALKSGHGCLRSLQVRRGQVGLFQVRRFKVEPGEVQSRPRRSGEIGTVQPRSGNLGRGTIRAQSVEQARGHADEPHSNPHSV